ncbi:hypothetical protein CCB80_02320 [Armatimonadetes bacterium Uphvl-Ar1]|nr:hypothetical protein CCB80_02320 [Armatimonadetes bacterium Uphvl-Ar1]
MDETRDLIEIFFNDEESSVVRNQALHRLQLIGDESIGLELLERAEGFADCDKDIVVFSLRQCGNEECSDKLLEWLEKSTDTELTTAICEVLGHIGKVEAVLPLLRLLDDARADVVFGRPLA